MKLFIFGAGASLASQLSTQDDGATPLQLSIGSPITNELFDMRYLETAKAVGLYKSDLEKYNNSIKESGKSLEGWLTEWWASIEAMKTPQSKRAAEKEFGSITFYIWWLLQQVSDTYTDYNGYRQFAFKLRDEDSEFGIINFNYDTLLDRALQQVMGYVLSDRMENYTSNNYIKPHGSVNWFLDRRIDDPIINTAAGYDTRVAVDIAASQMYASSMPMNMRIFSPILSSLSSLDFIRSGVFGNQYGYPLILIPLTTKLYTQVEGFHDRVIEDSKNLAALATEIFFIGYSASDTIIDDILVSAKADVTINVVSRGEGGKIMERILGIREDFVRGIIFDNGFTSFIDNYQR